MSVFTETRVFIVNGDEVELDMTGQNCWDKVKDRCNWRARRESNAGPSA